jgi:hypothetical protein
MATRFIFMVGFLPEDHHAPLIYGNQVFIVWTEVETRALILQTYSDPFV